MKRQRIDLQIDNHGSIYLLTPVSKAGQAWIDAHIPEDAMSWGRAIVVEHRYIRDIADGASADGLVVR